MSKKDNRDYIYLVWKDPNTRRNFVIGELSSNGRYEFAYGYEINEAIKNGFEPLISFEDINKVYTSDTLFPTFTSRLPDRKRRGLEKILEKYDLEEYDAYKLLKRSGARLPIDNLEFIDPIFEEDSTDFKRLFYVAGSRHHICCKGDDCNNSFHLEVGEQLNLVMEPDNEYDKNAIKITNNNGDTIGYVPRYYSEGITKYIKKVKNYRCEIVEVNKSKECAECIKVKIEVYFNVVNDFK